jgi:hypothetical protein
VGGAGPSTEEQRSRGPPGWKMPHFSDLCVGTWGIGEGGRRSNGQSEGKASKEAHQDGLQGQEVGAHGVPQQRGFAAPDVTWEVVGAIPLLLAVPIPSATRLEAVSIDPIGASGRPINTGSTYYPVPIYERAHRLSQARRSPLHYLRRPRDRYCPTARPLPSPECHRSSWPHRRSSAYPARYSGSPRFRAGASPGLGTRPASSYQMPRRNPDHRRRMSRRY